MDLALNNQKWLICYKTKPNQNKPHWHTHTHIYIHNIYMAVFILSIHTHTHTHTHHHHHHHQVVLIARSSLTIFRHQSLSSIAPGRSSKLYPIPTRSWSANTVGIYRISLMSFSLLLQHCSHVLFLLFGWFVRWKVSDRTSAVLRGVASIINLGLIWNKTCILLPTWYGNPITKQKREENKFHSISSKWTYNLSIFNFILLHSYWNDKLEIWSTCSAIKSHSLKESRPCLPLSNYLLTFRH